MAGLFYSFGELLPAKCLAQNPERCRSGNEEQTKTNRAAPAKPRAPRAPVFHASFVVPIVALLVLSTFALMLHSILFVILYGACHRGWFDYSFEQRELTHSCNG
jgi:hypothetical protein